MKDQRAGASAPDHESPYRVPRRDPVPAGWKRCTRCEVDHPADADHFHRSVTKADGLDSWCRTCVGLRSKRRRQMIGEAVTHRRIEQEASEAGATADSRGLRGWLPFGRKPTVEEATS